MAVLYEIISKFSSNRIEKELNIKTFLQSYSKLSNTDCKKVKGYFIQYVKLLIDQNLIEDKIEVIKNGIRYPTTSLNTKDIFDGIIIYEKIFLW